MTKLCINCKTGYFEHLEYFKEELSKSHDKPKTLIVGVYLIETCPNCDGSELKPRSD